jgi:hypothetical protein
MIKSHVLYRLSYALTFRLGMASPETGIAPAMREADRRFSEGHAPDGAV